MTKKLRKKHGEKLNKGYEERLEKVLESEGIFFQTLAYLEKTNRYKAIPEYRDASFATFIKDKFGIAYEYYARGRTVLTRYEDEIDKHGIAFARKVIVKAGDANAKKVFEEIDNMAVSQMTPIKSADKEAILAKHSRPLEQWVADMKSKGRQEFRGNSQPGI